MKPQAWIVACLMMTHPVVAHNVAAAGTVEALGKLKSATMPSLSPDGSQVAYLSNETGSPQVWLKPTSGGSPRQLTRLSDPVSEVLWSPDGAWLAYTVAPGGGLNTQIWIMRPDGTDVRRLTAGGTESNELGGWTRDGHALFASTNQYHPAANDAALIDVATGKWSFLTQDKGSNSVADVRGPQAIVGRLIGRGNVDLYAVDRTTGAERLLTPHTGNAQSGWGTLSADGRTVYVASDVGRDRAAFGTITLDAIGRPGPIRYFDVRDDAEAEGAVMSADGRTAALLWNAAGRSELVLRDMASERERRVALPVDIATLRDFAHDGRTLTFSGSSADRTTDTYVVDVATGKIRRVTESRHDGVDLARLARPQLITYTAADGLPLSGWLYRPAGVAAPMPVVFLYHGGPEGQARPTLSPDAQALVANGIAAFAPNVRGSSGFGKAFMALDDGAKRVNGIADIKATTDALVAKGIADPKRLGIMGGSYGGYMVMAGITEYPTMFAAAADLFGVVNFESFFEHTEPYIAAMSTTEYGDPKTQAAMLRSLSPIHKLDRVQTPLLVMHGANDTNVPIVEAEQIVSSLKARNVQVKYIVFPDEGHGWRKIANRARSTAEVTAFFAEHLSPSTH